MDVGRFVATCDDMASYSAFQKKSRPKLSAYATHLRMPETAAIGNEITRFHSSRNDSAISCQFTSHSAALMRSVKTDA